MSGVGFVCGGVDPDSGWTPAAKSHKACLSDHAPDKRQATNIPRCILSYINTGPSPAHNHTQMILTRRNLQLQIQCPYITARIHEVLHELVSPTPATVYAIIAKTLVSTKHSQLP